MYKAEKVAVIGAGFMGGSIALLSPMDPRARAAAV